jgi:UDP-N-acetylmuramate dehydrogenase
MVRVSVGAGEIWDEVVARTVDENLAGLECLSGIPGTAGATPIQNVGAYGQQVSDVIREVRVIDRVTLETRSMCVADCGFGYRTSSFRIAPDRYVVLGAVFELRPGGAPTLEYPELVRKLDVTGTTPSVSDVREAVVELRRAKSMTIEAGDPNRRSVGSFFVNPVIAEDAVPDLAESASVDDDEVPRFPSDNGLVKIPAAWLVEHSGFRKGLRRGGVGISSRHSLALVHHGGATTEELVALAREIRRGVRSRFGIDLKPEPRFLGFDEDDPTAGR